MSHLIFEFWHFPSIFVLLELTCLVTLFDFLSTQNVNVARFARNVEGDLLIDFQTLCCRNVI